MSNNYSVEEQTEMLDRLADADLNELRAIRSYFYEATRLQKCTYKLMRNVGAIVRDREDGIKKYNKKCARRLKNAEARNRKWN